MCNDERSCAKHTGEEEENKEVQQQHEVYV